MAVNRYCWRCKAVLPMLTEEEWDDLYPILSQDKEFIVSKRKETNLTLGDVLNQFETPACKKFYKMTGYKISDPNAIWHHRNSLLGNDCKNCGKPLRTPQAEFCAACGLTL